LGALKRRPAAGPIVVLDPGSGRTEEPVSGCEPVALAIGVAPTCPPGSAMSFARVDDQLAIHDVRDLVLLIRLARDPEVMGDRPISRRLAIAGWAVTIVVGGLGLLFVTGAALGKF